MTEDPNRREPGRLMTSTRAAAMWLAFLAVVIGGVLLLTLWSTRLAADRSWPWRWGSVVAAALGFLFLAWAMIAAFGVFTQASASPADPGFLSVQPPRRFFQRRGPRSRDDLQELMSRTARILGAAETEKKKNPPEAEANQPAGETEENKNPPEAEAKRPRAEGLDFEIPGWVILPADRSSQPDARQSTPRDGGNRSQGKYLVLSAGAVSGLLAPRNHWIARVWLRAAGERMAIGVLATIVAVLLLASGRVAQASPKPPIPSPRPTRTYSSTPPPSSPPASSSTSSVTSPTSSPSNGNPTSSPTSPVTSPTSSPSNGNPTSSPTSPVTSPTSSSGHGTPKPAFPLSQALVGNVVAGVAPVLADTLIPSLATLGAEATSAAVTPEELEAKALDLALNDVAAPLLHAGSEKLGDALASALIQRTGLTRKPPTPPSTKAVMQVQVALQEKLQAELALMLNIRVVADHAELSPNQLATELADTIAQRLAYALAYGLVQLPSSSRLDGHPATAIAGRFVKGQLPPPPPPTVAYTVQPGDSLWDISRRLLGPRATAHEIDQTSQVIYRDNRTTIGANPNRLVPGQVLRIPNTGESGLSQGWVPLPWLVVAPGTLSGIAVRRRRRSHRAKDSCQPACGGR